ncbi:NADPH oxidase activator 1 [Platysternon megacephalum]|uniref:NADPH oxidase activator 1 n=1 Tax=Platysternon megacephalum TaxID=55544 RepID=A0A4D9E1U2_9SAUR|nr:NADPH oxidase activator 1 [Platysternon megacephalum]
MFRALCFKARYCELCILSLIYCSLVVLLKVHFCHVIRWNVTICGSFVVEEWLPLVYKASYSKCFKGDRTSKFIRWCCSSLYTILAQVCVDLFSISSKNKTKNTPKHLFKNQITTCKRWGQDIIKLSLLLPPLSIPPSQ